VQLEIERLQSEMKVTIYSTYNHLISQNFGSSKLG
jgi:hypothetical protein